MIIGLSGKAQSGKTTAGDYLVEKYGFIKINFKDDLVDEMKIVLNDTLSEIVKAMDAINWNGVNPWSIDKLFKDKPPLMRALMQNYGTDVRRKDDENYWIGKWSTKVFDAQHKDLNVVVDDCRFLNEADAIRLMTGKLIRVERTDITDTGNHQSETEMDRIEVDMTFRCNKGEQDKLYRMLDLFIEEHGE